MSRGYRRRENDSFVNQRGERRSRRNESRQPKPFTGFTSPYRRLNEQALLQKNHHHHHQHPHADNSLREKRFSSHRNESQHQQQPSWENRRRSSSRNFGPMTPTRHPPQMDAKGATPAAGSDKNFDRNYSSKSPFDRGGAAGGGGGGGAATSSMSKMSGAEPRHSGHWRGEHEKDKYHTHSSINPWSDKYARQTKNLINENKAMKRLNEESVYGKVSWEYDVPQEEGNQYKNYEKPMDPKEFREQCRRAYVRAAEERQRNAELSVWGKCDWATYDKYKNSRY